jgi:hypothetical protein
MRALKGLLAIAVVCSCVSGRALAGQIFHEGFEVPCVAAYPGSNGYWLNYGTNTVPREGTSGSLGLSFVGDSGLTWTVDTGSVDITAATPDTWVAAVGQQCVDLAGWEPGSMFTTFDLAPGDYDLSFAFSKHYGLGDSPAHIAVLWDSLPVAGSPLAITTTNTPTEMHWQWANVPISIPDVGQGIVSHTLRFTCLDDGSECGPTIDEVSLNSVPEPAAFTLLGVGAISLLAYAWRRRHAA